jgi:hypothetical protein
LLLRIGVVVSIQLSSVRLNRLQPSFFVREGCRVEEVRTTGKGHDVVGSTWWVVVATDLEEFPGGRWVEYFGVTLFHAANRVREHDETRSRKLGMFFFWRRSRGRGSVRVCIDAAARAARRTIPSSCMKTNQKSSM